jgi:two-component system, cell cycle sensor histidine kinase and response regulator CckA
VRSLMRRILEEAGYRVVEARQPGEALQAAREAAPHLLLTDVVMPGMAGPELAQALLAARPELRVLYVSGYTENAALRSGALPPGQGFLQKPFRGDELARAVRERSTRRSRSPPGSVRTGRCRRPPPTSPASCRGCSPLGAP